MTYTMPTWIRNMWREIVKRYGWRAFIDVLRASFPDLDLYQVGTSWYDDDEFVLKSKGCKGDLLIYWEK